jgi:RHS repeat-associated protein
MVEQLNSSGTATARYTQGLGIDEPLEVYEGGKSYYYHADGLGSIVALTKSTGTAANTYFGYNTFGGMPNPSETVANPFRFTAREWDSETSLYYYRARYYDSLFGRFISEDPIGMNGGVNAYRFEVNDPATLRDPRGLWPESLQAIVSDVSDVTSWLAGRGGAGINHVEDPAAHELSDTPGMQDIRRQYKEMNCRYSGYLCNDYQYSQLITTDSLTGQLVGSFCAKFVPISKGRVLVEAQNTWGLESGTRLPKIGNENNRNNPSIQQMLLNGAPLAYPKSILENRTAGPMKNLTVHYIWTEKSPCCGN